MSGPVLELERLRSPEVRALLDRGMRTAVFACGAVEQHGPHLPMFMDAEHGTHLALAVAERLGDALVAPTIRVGCSDHHLAFAGSLSIRSSTLVALLHDYCRSLAHHGFERVCIIPSHGGNFRIIEEAVPGLRAEFPALTIVAFTDIMALMRLWTELAEAESGLGERVGGHADIAETAIMLAMHPDLVRQDLAAEGYRGGITPEKLEQMIRDGFDTVSPNGILGDARGASAALGQRLIQGVADEIVRLLDTSRPASA
ncbi:MAG: creatininase family protein [Gemmatimonadota bacterium]